MGGERRASYTLGGTCDVQQRFHFLVLNFLVGHELPFCASGPEFGTCESLLR